jgi:foldase protein PrsA
VSTTIKNLLQSQAQQKALNDFVKDFQKRYKDKTDCAKGYIVDQCKNAPKQSTNTAPVSGSAPQTGGTPQQVPPSSGATPQPSQPTP